MFFLQRFINFASKFNIIKNYGKEGYKYRSKGHNSSYN